MVRSSSEVEMPLESYLKPNSFIYWKEQTYRILSRDHKNVQVESVPAIEPYTFKIVDLVVLNGEVPPVFAMLYLADGTAYLPVRALCRMLGLRAEAHIPRWRKLFLWANARKLSLQTVRGERMVWCLHRGALPFWCVCFNWSLVLAERREQLRQATDAWQEDVSQAQQLLLDRYRSLRRDLFAFLETYTDAETWLDQWGLRISASLDIASSRQIELLLSQGKTLIGQVTTQARKMVLEQAILPPWTLSRSTRVERWPR